MIEPRPCTTIVAPRRYAGAARRVVYNEPRELLALVLAWSRERPGRRGGAHRSSAAAVHVRRTPSRARFQQQRPGKSTFTGPLHSIRMSRAQLHLTPVDGALRIESIITRNTVYIAEVLRRLRGWRRVHGDPRVNRALSCSVPAGHLEQRRERVFLRAAGSVDFYDVARRDRWMGNVLRWQRRRRHRSHFGCRRTADVGLYFSELLICNTDAAVRVRA